MGTAPYDLKKTGKSNSVCNASYSLSCFHGGKVISCHQLRVMFQQKSQVVDIN